MTDRKFYYRQFVIKVVSEEPVRSPEELCQVIANGGTGNSSSVWSSREDQTSTKKRTLDGKQAAEMILKMGATPELFDLKRNGDDTD